MFKSRLFRILVCAVLIFSLVFNVVSIPSKALVIADDIALGITALLLLAACGMVIVPQASLDISNVGQSFRTSMLDWGKSTDTYDDVVVWIDAFSLYDPSGGDDDGDDSPNETKVKLARGILAGITAWIASTIMAGKVETEGETASDGYAYYNGHYLKKFEEYSTLPARIILQNSEGVYFLYEPQNSYYVSDEYFHFGLGFRSTYSDDTWVGEGLSSHNYLSFSDYSYIWSNVDIFNGDVLIHAGSDPAYDDKIIVQPSIYVGDLPQQIQNGDKDEDDIVLPPEIDYSKLIQDGQTLQQSVTDTMSQLADGTLTYEDYLTKIESVTETVPDSGTSTDTWTPPENPGQFALDLSNYFPFCIPFDLYDFFSCLNADPVAPVIHWEIALPGGSTYPIELDLSPFDSVAQLLRRLQLLLFIVGLAIKTRDLIKG